ncbi:phosphoglycerate dehydrogenase [Roseivirga sp.]|uniref:phosphoglycerate dehydrogenase n=1 Tax=Roseivirga sp. TaxID=1964215 RepID=UPI002B278B70|nr:phosphoglycerate dehydrogenase [Roseivirga sp.]
MAYRILTTTSSFGKVDPAPLDLLKTKGFEVTVNPYGRKLSVEESKEILKDYDGLIAGTESLNEEVLNAAADLKYLCRLGAGMDNVDFSAAERLNITVENTPSAHVDGVAELTLGGILSCLRSIANAHTNITNGIWEKPMGSLLKGKTVGIIGLGRVGCRLVELLAPFKVKVLAFDLYENTEFAKKQNVTYVAIDELISASDIITIHTPFSPEAKHMVNTEFFTKAKKNLCLVNASRGGLVNEDALLEFLNSNPTASAYLDTFEEEPYVGPLSKMKNCTLTPHIGSYASEVRINMEMEAAQNVIKFFKK